MNSFMPRSSASFCLARASLSFSFAAFDSPFGSSFERFAFQRPHLLQQPAHLRQRLHRAFVGIRMRLAGPDGVFVELDVLGRHAAINHRAHVTVADRQRFFPAFGGLAIPQRQ